MKLEVANVDWLLWAPLAAAGLHICEEFVWPGGFVSWYRSYRASAASVKPSFLIIINALLLFGCFEGALAGHIAIGAAYLLTLTAVLFSNGCWHLWASYASRSYSPGMITGALLYLPLGVFEYVTWVRLGQASLATAAAAILIGGSYPFWSAAYHKRHAHPSP
jgi:hypothetical protein